MDYAVQELIKRINPEWQVTQVEFGKKDFFRNWYKVTTDVFYHNNEIIEFHVKHDRGCYFFNDGFNCFNKLVHFRVTEGEEECIRDIKGYMYIKQVKEAKHAKDYEKVREYEYMEEMKELQHKEALNKLIDAVKEFYEANNNEQFIEAVKEFYKANNYEK